MDLLIYKRWDQVPYIIIAYDNVHVSSLNSNSELTSFVIIGVTETRISNDDLAP